MKSIILMSKLLRVINKQICIRIYRNFKILQDFGSCHASEAFLVGLFDGWLVVLVQMM